MDTLLQSLASLFLVLHPLSVTNPLRPDHFVGAAQIGALFIVAGWGAVVFIRAGVPRAPAVLLPMIAAICLGGWIFAHHGNPWGLAENFCALVGAAFRFLAGIGVVLGLLLLIGLRPLRRRNYRLDIAHPVVVLPTLCYAALVLPSLRHCAGNYAAQVGLALSLGAVWLSFAGVLAIIRHLAGPLADDRALAMTAGGCAILLLLSHLHPPYAGTFQALHAASFPAGLFVGAFTAFARIDSSVVRRQSGLGVYG